MRTIPIADAEAPAVTRPVPRSVPPGVLGSVSGETYHGTLRGQPTRAEGDLIFTTASTGWGEILTDPSYAGQIVVLTHPMAGNYRIADDELESARVHARALVCSRLVSAPDGPGRSLEDVLVHAGIPALTGVDTRAITLSLRRGAARRAVIRPAPVTDEDLRADAAGVVPWEAVDHVAGVATPKPYTVAPTAPRAARAALIDFGVKRSLLAALADRGLEVRVLPHDARPADVWATAPDLVVLSPGPGDPTGMRDQISTVGELARSARNGGPPILGICLGHQLLALAAGAITRRLAVGHHGGNHAVLDLESGRVDIGAHNHEVEVVDGPALAAAGYRVSHRDLNDGTVEGLVHESGRIASVQFHPEGAPGPIDASRIFDLALRAATK